jgi:predicted DNA-binding protein (MmcQ/YjbR family)
MSESLARSGLQPGRERLRPRYHQNQRPWNAVDLDGTIDDGELREMIEHSYGLVVDGLPRAQRARLSGG